VQRNDQMIKLTKNMYAVLLLLILLGLAGCGSDLNGASEPDEDDTALEETVETEESDLTNKAEDEKASTDKPNNTSSKESSTDANHASESEADNLLADYDSEEIEYARVWLQLGANQDIDELNVRPIPA